MGKRREAESAEGSTDEFTRRVIGGAIAVHRVLGCGLLESAYAACLEWELTARGFAVRRQVRVPVTYGGVQLECGYRIDMVIDGRLILELKAVELILPIHKAQLLSYLRLTGLRFGLLINFHSRTLADGVTRIVNPDVSASSAYSASLR
jgi:GxxExxY protein